MAKNDNPFCGGLFAFGMGLILIYGATQRYLLAQKIKNTPTSKVRSAAVGLVELFGKAKCNESILSPVSKVKCAYWRLKCEYYKPGKHGGWRDIYTPASDSKTFFLEDDTGKMLIDPKGAEIDIPSDFKSEGHLAAGGIAGLFKNKVLDAKVLAFLEEDSAAKTAFHNHSSFNLRLTEFFIAEGDPLYVLGNAEPQKGASSALAHENLLMKKGGGENLMYISDSGERSVIGKVQGGIWWMLGLGFVLAAIGLFAMLSTVFK